jgi:hypothetical protein
MVEKLDGLSKGIGIPDGFVANSTYWFADETGVSIKDIGV